MTTFTNEGTLRAFPQFQKLDDNIQAIVLQLLRDDRLNNYGGFKRPPNAWLIFRSDTLAAVDPSTLSQSQLTVRCKALWTVVTIQQRAALQKRAQQANEELLRFFPDYCYKPMSATEKERWKWLSTNQRKEFWLASAVRIAERIAKPEGEWEGFLRFDKWMKGQTLRSPTDISPVEGGSATPPDNRATPEPKPSIPRFGRHRPRLRDDICINPGNSNRSASPATMRASSIPVHPYHSALDARAPANAQAQHESVETNPLPEWLKGVLVDIGPQKSGDKRRRLALSTFQQQKGPLIWVEDEIQDDVPEAALRKLYKVQPDETSPNHIILRGFSNPWIPASKNEYGGFRVPRLESASQYHEYMAAYHAANEVGSDFIWSPALLHSPNDSELAAGFGAAAPTDVSLGAGTHDTSDLFLESRSPTHTDLAPNRHPANKVHPLNIGQLEEVPQATNIKPETSQIHPCGGNSPDLAHHPVPLDTGFALGLAGLDNFNLDSYQSLSPTHDASTQMSWTSFPDIAVGSGSALANGRSMGLEGC